jgi:lipid A 3-O-deacylase
MTRQSLWVLVGLAVLGLGAATTHAAYAQQDDHDTIDEHAIITGQSAGGSGLLSEVRIGLLAHDIPILGPQREHGADVNSELLFVSPVPEAAVAGVASAARWLLRPRPVIGFSQNLNGYTSQVYLGFDVGTPIAHGLLRRQDAVLFDAGFGAAINNDRTLGSARNRLHLGANVLFHPNLQFGYAFDSRYSIALYYEHSSNAHLARYNEGLNNVGVRFGRTL